MKEEPNNIGAWPFLHVRLSALLGPNDKLGRWASKGTSITAGRILARGAAAAIQFLRRAEATPRLHHTQKYRPGNGERTSSVIRTVRRLVVIEHVVLTALTR